MKTTDKTDLQKKIFRLVRKQLGGQLVTRAGIVYVRLPDGAFWDFTVPMEVTSHSRLEKARALFGKEGER